MLHHAGFRKVCLEVGWAIGRIARWLLDRCAGPGVAFALGAGDSGQPLFSPGRAYLIKPAFISGLLAALFWVMAGEAISPGWGLTLFLAVAGLVNSRLGRDVDEMLTDWVVQAWHHIRIHVFSALFRLIVDLFQRLLETIERLLYTVDEWLRFKAGERPMTTVCKVVLTPIWRDLELRHPHFRQSADRAADQSDQALSGGDGLAQVHLAVSADADQHSFRAAGAGVGQRDRTAHDLSACPACSAFWLGS